MRRRRRRREYCGSPERHEYELYLAVEDIDHTRTKTKSPQTNGNLILILPEALARFFQQGSVELYRKAARGRACVTIINRSRLSGHALRSAIGDRVSIAVAH